MADIQVEAPADDIEFYTPGAGSKPGPYHAHVQKLIAADEARTDEQKAEGTHASLPITVPNVIEEDGKKFDGVARHKRYFQESARFLNMTAQEIDRKEGAENTVIRFVVKPLVKRPRKPAEAAETAEASTETPAESAPVEKTGGKARAPQAA
jgi:hypothetical protein